tara:strand:+ start:1464 stop:2789 length:1326 start_codon:yes stop_codon:yes gene_type:complete
VLFWRSFGRYLSSHYYFATGSHQQQNSAPPPKKKKKRARIVIVTMQSAATSSVQRQFSPQRRFAHSSSTTRRGGRQHRQKSSSSSPRVLTTTTTKAVANTTQLPAENKDVKVLVVGATGYIGKFVTNELCSQGYDVTAYVRPRSGIGGKNTEEDAKKLFTNAKVEFGVCSSVEDVEQNAFKGGNEKYDVVVSCLASRTGGVKDSWDVDYQATKNVLDVARKNGAKKFVLLSAICVQKPLLTFQKAKLKFEEELEKCEDISYSIVRPTAFFKSLAGQVESVQKGGPYVMFGDGQLASCKPISERDLAKYMAECIRDVNLENKVLPIGGPGKALSALEQGTMLFELLEMEPKFIKVPIEVMDTVIKVLDFFAGFFGNMTDAAEFGKIGRYYAAESMLVMDKETGEYKADETPSYGTDTLRDFFKKVSVEGLAGQELGDQAVFK